MSSNEKFETSMTPPEPTQMALALPVTRSFAKEDLALSSANKTAIELICGWPHWPGNLVIMAGPVGSGKTHLANVWVNNAKAKMLPFHDLNQGHISEMELNSEFDRPILIEDAGQGSFDEVAMFHLLNAKKSANASVLITSRTWPSEWAIKLPDLVSRLRAAQLVELGEPDDQLLRQVLFKLFSDRQLPVEIGVIDYLVQRMERSLQAANSIVTKLDELSLQRKIKISRKLGAHVLKAMDRPQD